MNEQEEEEPISNFRLAIILYPFILVLVILFHLLIQYALIYDSFYTGDGPGLSMELLVWAWDNLLFDMVLSLFITPLFMLFMHFLFKRLESENLAI